jgi:hypothetical protein
MKIIHRLLFIFAVVALLVLPAQAGPSDSSFDGVLNATYTIEKQEVRLIGGRSEVQAAPGSAAKITTVVFGEPVCGDLDGDGREDATLFLMNDPGASGSFYYVAAAIAKNGIYQGTNGVFLGDRIAPRTIQIRNNIIVADYADRRPDEPMASPPSIAKTMYLKLKAGHLEAIEAPWER